MQRIWQAIYRRLELPPELVSKEPKVAFYPEQKKVIVDNPQKILHYDKSQISVDINRKILKIVGKNLSINLLLPDSLEVSGELLKLEVENHG